MNLADELKLNYKGLMQSYKQDSLSRRDILKTGCYASGLVSGITGIFSFLGLPSFAEAGISMPEIMRLTNRHTVDDILLKEFDDGLIKKVKYDRKKINFDELVFQHKLKPEQRKASLVLFYGSPGENDSNYEKRAAVILKELSKEFKKQLLFVSYNVSETKNISDNILDIWQEITASHKVNASPSLAMYSTFDLARQETPERNDGKIKQVDILRGGPDANWRIIEDWLPFLKDKWIATNLTSLNNAYAWRFKNSGKKSRIFYNRNRRRVPGELLI